MQFHLNGFTPGDPSELYHHKGVSISTPPKTITSSVDVLIIGAGPAGLALAAQLSKYPSITTRLIEEKSARLTLGQADGLQCRSLEMFEAFGFSEKVLKEAYWVNETTFWKPDDGDRGRIVRSGRIRDTEEGLSEFPHVILNQARVHDFFLEVMRDSPSRMTPDYARSLTGINYDGDDADHPITVQLEVREPGDEGVVQRVKTRYLVGCEGARSWVRQSLDLKLDGDSANQAWGVMDVLAVSNFPDYRTKTAIHSADQGSVLIIPREGGYLVRFYVELEKLEAGERVSSRNITKEQLIRTAQSILAPYTLEVKEVPWWSVYVIGQRLCSRFDNVPEEEKSTRFPNVFIAGDACHTHSPKAGQGMNVSMQDGFNLGWKLASVVLGRASPEILHTYSAERQKVAKELIDFDREFAKMFSARPKESEDDTEGIDPAEFQKYFQKQGRFTAGMGTTYASSLITAEPKYQHLAKGFVIGTRFHSSRVLRLADAKPVHLGHVVKADGRWRVFVFAGAENPASAESSLRKLCCFLAESNKSPLKRYTPQDADIDSVIDVHAVLQQDHTFLSMHAMPDILWPQKGRYGLRDYEKIYCAEQIERQDDIYEARGIERKEGCVVVVRPDQYVAHVLPADAHAELAAFFGGFMVEER